MLHFGRTHWQQLHAEFDYTMYSLAYACRPALALTSGS